MIAEIIPQIRLPKSIGIFDYQVPKNLELEIKVGQVVYILFRKRKMPGLVFSLKKTTLIKKPLSFILSLSKQAPLLTKTQINLINQLTKYYFISPALLVKSILPQIPKNIYKKDFKKIIPKILDLKISKSKIGYLKKVGQKIAIENRSSLLRFDSLGQKILLYLYLIDYYLKLNQQVAIIVPEITDIAILYPIIARKFAKTAYYHGHLAKNEQFNVWNNILNDKIKVIIGTRPLCFAPFNNLGLVIIDQEENDSHKQYDQNPRYHVAKVIEELKRICKFKLLLTARTPSVTAYWQVKKNHLNYIDITAPLKSKLSIVDLNQTFKTSGFTFISDKLISKITSCLSLNQQIFLYVNRRGFSTRIFCSDCSHVFSCPNCSLPLTSLPTLKLTCYHCGHQSESPKACPHCQGIKIKFTGLGLEKVVENVKIIFPDKQIIGLSATTFGEQNNYSNYDIVIGTSIVLKNAFLPRLRMIGIINADSSLNYPDFKASEKTFSGLDLMINYKKETEVVMQTFSPDNPVIKACIKKDYEKFFQFEIKNRKDFDYPPFCKLIKLIYQDIDEKKVKSAAESLNHILQGSLPEKWTIVSLEATPYKQRSKYRHLIIIKCTGPIPQSFIKLIPDNWLIDIDPINFD